MPWDRSTPGRQWRGESSWYALMLNVFLRTGLATVNINIKCKVTLVHTIYLMLSLWIFCLFSIFSCGVDTEHIIKDIITPVFNMKTYFKLISLIYWFMVSTIVMLFIFSLFCIFPFSCVAVNVNVNHSWTHIISYIF